MSGFTPRPPVTGESSDWYIANMLWAMWKEMETQRQRVRQIEAAMSQQIKVDAVNWRYILDRIDEVQHGIDAGKSTPANQRNRITFEIRIPYRVFKPWKIITCRATLDKLGAEYVEFTERGFMFKKIHTFRGTVEAGNLPNYPGWELYHELGKDGVLRFLLRERKPDV